MRSRNWPDANWSDTFYPEWDDIISKAKPKSCGQENHRARDGCDWKWERSIAESTHVRGLSNQAPLTLTLFAAKISPSRAATQQ